MTEQQTTFKRFSPNERIQHIVLVITFILLAATGIPQKFSNLPWAQIMIDLMGGIEAARYIHRISAAILIAGTLYHIVFGLYQLLVRKAPFDMLPRPKDVTDVIHNLGYMLGLQKSRPRFGRFTYMEKFEYWALIWGTIIMVLSGLLLWFPILTTHYLPGAFIPGAKALHGNEALLAISAIVLWHLYNAHLNPRIFPMNFSMFTGEISKHEMILEHPLEYEKLTGETVPDSVLSEQPPKSWPVVVSSGVLGMFLVILYVMMIQWTIQPPSPTLADPIVTPVGRQLVVNPYATPTPNLIAAGPTETPAKPCNKERTSNALLANFRADAVDGIGPLEGAPPQPFQFTDLSVGEINCWEWQFGDGQSSTEQNPYHIFESCPGDQGLCTVTLTVCGPDGCASEKKFDYIWVSDSASCRGGC
jgi:formate dehydrogenase subunit gamma